MVHQDECPWEPVVIMLQLFQKVEHYARDDERG
jgi:hypothetical protein